MIFGALLTVGSTDRGEAQQVLIQPDRVINVARGGSALLTEPRDLERVSVGDDAIAEAVVLPPRQILLNARAVGTTSLLVWREGEAARLYEVQVSADVAALTTQLGELFPDFDVDISTAGDALVLSGAVRDPGVARRAIQLAEATGAPVIDNLTAPSPEQILLHVRFAEVDRSVVKEFGGDLIRAINAPRLNDSFDRDDESIISTLAEGLVTLSILGDTGAGIEAVISALRGRGEFRSLAEPNLVALEGQEATFLAGGEFPFPSLQSGAASNSVTIIWKEFGVRLNFVPTVTNAGTIRLSVEPEVSSLDFANGLVFSGFQIPSILTRRVNTSVELAPGQTLAIGGLLDNRLLHEVDRVPVLGHIPILGAFFSSKRAREDRTELLVLVTPYIVEPSDDPIPVPTGEPETWNFDSHLRTPPDSIGSRN
ncbi:MAG: type II and III secretion system protein family protein [Gemmatimonadota bacterium]|nr:type II and III secretion system protein family protein [Gemmatimonadota bacterium]